MRATDVSRLGYVAPVPPATPGAAAPVERRADVESPKPEKPELPPLQPQRACDRVLWFVDRYRYRLFLALFGLYLLGFNGQWRPEPDSALYLVIGRNLALGEGYTYHGQSHRLVFPGLPLVFAGLFKTFGTNSVVPHCLSMLAMGAAALALIYRLFLLHAGRPMAVLVTLLVGVSQTFYRYNFELLTDLPFMLGVMAFLVGYEGVVHKHPHDDPTPTIYPRGKPHLIDWALLLLGLAAAVVTRPTMLALLAAAAGAALWPILRGRFRWGSVAVFIVVAVACAAFYRFDPRGSGGGDYERMLLRPDLLARNWHHAVTVNLPKLIQPTVSEAVFAVDFSKPGNIFLSIVLILTSFSLFRAHALWGLLVVMTGVMLVAVEVHVRYLLFILPLLIYAWFRVLMYLDYKLRPAIGDRLFAAVLTVFIGTNVARDGKIIIEQRWPPPLAAYKDGRFASLSELAEQIRAKTEPHAWILVRHKFGRILTFASGRYAVEPQEGTELDVTWQPVYVLDPVDTKEEDSVYTRTSEWMTAHDVVRGAEVLRFQGKRDRQAWILSRAVSLKPTPAKVPGGTAP